MFTVYSKPACPACDNAKALLKSKSIPHQVVHLDIGQPKAADESYISRDELLAKIPSARTMPQIFNDESYVGGFTELKSLLETQVA